MSRISPITRILVPAALALAIAPSAFAQDAAGNRVSVVAGYSMVEPTRNPEISGTRTEFDGEGTPTLGVTYHITDNWGVEAWAADSHGQRVNAGGGKVGNVEAQPYALSGQYRFGNADSTLRLPPDQLRPREPDPGRRAGRHRNRQGRGGHGRHGRQHHPDLVRPRRRALLPGRFRRGDQRREGR